MLTTKSRILLIKIVRREIQKTAFDAYAFEVFGIDTPIGRASSERRRLLKIALEELKELQEPSHEQTNH